MSLVRRIASQSSIIFAARIGGAGLIFIVQAMIARQWGAAVLGDYLIIFAVVNLVAMVLPLGFQTVGTYFTAEYRAHGDRAQLWQFVLRAYGHIALVGLLVLIAGGAALGALGLENSPAGRYFVPTWLLAVSGGLVFVNSALLVGLRRPIAGFIADSSFRPLIMIGGFFCASLWANSGDSLGAMLWVVSLVYVGVVLVQFALVIASVRAVPDSLPPTPAETRRWWRFALPWVLIAVATDFFFDIDLLLLAGLMDNHELAVFGVCTRIFALISFGVAAVYAVTLPEMFEANANADRTGFDRKIGEANLVAAGLSVLMFFGLLVGGPIALMLFGPDFAEGALPLSILSLGLVVRSIFGPAAMVLSIRDRPYASLPAVGLGLATLIIGNMVLVPPLHLVGAAIAALVAITLWSVALWFTAYRVAGIDVSIFRRFRKSVALTA